MKEKEQESLSSKWPENIEKALALPLGAKYFRCALQVNPFSYLKSNRGEDHGLSEEEYYSHLVSKCLVVLWVGDKKIGMITIPEDSPDKPYKAHQGSRWVTFGIK